MAAKKTSARSLQGEKTSDKPNGGKFNLLLPDFSNQYFRSLHICFHFPTPIPVEPIDGDARFGSDAWFHVVVGEVPKGKISQTHLHFDIVKGLKGRRQIAASHDLSELISRVAKFAGMTALAWIAAEYFVPVDILPRRGAIDAFLGLSTKTGGVNLGFIGATMKIEDESLDELSWKLTPDRKNVSIELDMLISCTVDNECCLKAEQVATSALKRLILDGERPHHG